MPIVKHTNNQLLRIYPLALNVLSGNYKPILPWTTGAQMVALNYQTNGSAMRKGSKVNI